jgi:hypothetical protein
LTLFQPPYVALTRSSGTVAIRHSTCMVGARSTVVRLPSRDTRCCRARPFPSSPRLFGTPYRWVAVVINLTDIFVSERRPPVDAASQQPVPWQHQLAPVHISIAIDMRRRSSSSSGQSTYACNDSDRSSVSAPAKKKIRPPRRAPVTAPRAAPRPRHPSQRRLSSPANKPHCRPRIFPREVHTPQLPGHVPGGRGGLVSTYVRGPGRTARRSHGRSGREKRCSGSDRIFPMRAERGWIVRRSICNSFFFVRADGNIRRDY